MKAFVTGRRHRVQSPTQTSTAYGEAAEKSDVGLSRYCDDDSRKEYGPIEQYVHRARRVLDFINISQRERKLCDVIVSTKGGELQVHILASKLINAFKICVVFVFTVITNIRSLFMNVR